MSLQSPQKHIHKQWRFDCFFLLLDDDLLPNTKKHFLLINFYRVSLNKVFNADFNCHCLAMTGTQSKTMLSKKSSRVVARSAATKPTALKQRFHRWVIVKETRSLFAIVKVFRALNDSVTKENVSINHLVVTRLHVDTHSSLSDESRRKKANLSIMLIARHLSIHRSHHQYPQRAFTSSSDLRCPTRRCLCHNLKVLTATFPWQSLRQVLSRQSSFWWFPSAPSSLVIWWI